MSMAAPETPSSYNSINDALSSNGDFETDSEEEEEPPKTPWGQISQFRHPDVRSIDPADDFVEFLRKDLPKRRELSGLADKHRESLLTKTARSLSADYRSRLRSTEPDSRHREQTLPDNISSSPIGLGITTSNVDELPHNHQFPAATTSRTLNRTTNSADSFSKSSLRRLTPPRRHPEDPRATENCTGMASSKMCPTVCSEEGHSTRARPRSLPSPDWNRFFGRKSPMIPVI